MKFKLVDEYRLKENVNELIGNRGNAYSSSKFLLNSIGYSDDKCDYKSYLDDSHNIEEGIDFEFVEKEKGGIIVFSTDVNAVPLSTNKIINWLKQKIVTIGNRLNTNRKIDKIVGGKYEATAWTVGKYLSGRYTAKNGNFFGENSVSVEIIGITLDTLINVAEDLCEEFLQESVLVKSYADGGRIFLVNAQ